MNLFGVSLKENKYDLYHLVCGALLAGFYIRIIFLIMTLNCYYVSLESSWLRYGLICLFLIPIFSVLSIFIFRKQKFRMTYLYFNWVILIEISLFLLFDDFTSLFVLCCIIASTIGLIYPSILSMVGFLTKFEYRGRVTGFIITVGLILTSFFFLTSLFLTFTINILLYILFIGITTLLNFRTKRRLVFSLKESIELPNRTRIFMQFAFATFFLMFVAGIGVINIITPTISEIYDVFLTIIPVIFHSHAVEFAGFILLLAWAILNILNGFIADYLGRKHLIIISLISFYIAFFGWISLTFGIPLIPIPIMIGLGAFYASAALVFIIVVSGDLFKEEGMHIGYSISFCFFAMGLLIGVLSGSTLITQFIMLVLGFMVLNVILILFIVYTKETRPSKEELAWKSALLEIYCIASKGICIYHHQFRERTAIDADLIAGGLSGIVSLIQEMTKSEKRTRIIDQEENKFLLEFGDNVTCVLISSADLKVLRKKLGVLTNEVEDLFKDVFPIWTGDLSIFIPIGSLIKKHFT